MTPARRYLIFGLSCWALAAILALRWHRETAVPDEADDMCPNCITPWKCNGPHLSGEYPVAVWREPEPLIVRCNHGYDAGPNWPRARCSLPVGHRWSHDWGADADDDPDPYAVTGI